MFAIAYKMCGRLRLLLLHCHRRLILQPDRLKTRKTIDLTHCTHLTTDLLCGRGRQELEVILLVSGNTLGQEDGIVLRVCPNKADDILILQVCEGVGQCPLEVSM